MQPVEPYTQTESGQRTAHPLRVFLVEDSAVIRQSLTETIASLDHVEVVGHAEGETEAIAALQALECDAVVLDLQLKEGHGFNVLKAVRGRSSTPRIVVLVLSNYATPQYRTRSMDIGADYFFDKAREYDLLCEVLERLGVRRAGDETSGVN
jgi:DNA-binding NarL/FixJ family response regulator